MVSIHTVMTIQAYVRLACMGPVFVIVMSESVCVTEIRVENLSLYASVAQVSRNKRPRSTRVKSAPTVHRAPSTVVPDYTEQLC